MRRFACLRLMSWPVQRLHVGRPELRGRAVLITQRDARRAERVVDCCGLARRAGVRPGMPLAEAATLCEDCEVAPADPAGDLAALGRLAAWAGRFGPAVGWETLSPRSAGPPAVPWYGETPTHVFIDVTGVAGLFGGEDALARRVVSDCRGLGLTVRIAIAPTLGAAWAVAEAGEPVAVVSDVELTAILEPLPVATLRMSVDVLHALDRLGVQTVGQLRRLPRDGLARRFGRQVALRLDQALGAAGEVLVPCHTPPRFEAEHRLEEPTERWEDIDWLVGDLTRQITGELQAHGVGAVRLTGRLDCGPGKAVTFGLGLFRPAGCPIRLLELLRLRLERLTLPGPVSRVELRADRTARVRRRQAGLFTDPDGDVDPGMAALVERLASRIGVAAVVRPELIADALPERAYRYAPMIGRRSPARLSQQYGIGERPLRLFAPPPRVEAVAAAGGPPASFHWSGRHAVARTWGPERIETGWWRGGTVRRDYYRVETDAGRRFWLFRDLIRRAWHLHGSFE